MRLIVGLGNVGTQYARTRHNIGFMIVDELANTLGANWKNESKLKANLATPEIGGQTAENKVLLAKPQTMMNLSGEAVQRIMQFYKIAPADVVVIYDEVDVPFGRLRIRQGGSSGHQGINSLIQHIGPNFARFRVGISLNDRHKEPSEVYVLKPFNEDETQQLPALIKATVEQIQNYIALEQTQDSTINLF